MSTTPGAFGRTVRRPSPPSLSPDARRQDEPRRSPQGEGGFGYERDDKGDIYPESHRIIILTPCFAFQLHDEMRKSVEAAKSLAARFRCADGQVRTLPVIADWFTLGNDSHVDRARNTLLHPWRKSPYRFGLWWDGDVQGPPRAVLRIWQHLMRNVHIVVGLYAMKTIVPTFVANIVEGAEIDKETSLIELIDGGTGFMGFDRHVVDTIEAEWPKQVRAAVSRALASSFVNHTSSFDSATEKILEELNTFASLDLTFGYAPNTPFAGQKGFALFGSGPVTRGGERRWLSEDWMLCHRWQLCGGKVYGDTTVNLHHWGPMCFPPDLGDLFDGTATMLRGTSSPIPEDLRKKALPAIEELCRWARQPKPAKAA